MTEDIPTAFFRGATLDDLMHSVLDQIQRSGDDIFPTKGQARELQGVLLELTNPLARLSQTETRGVPFSCLGELLWYLAKSNALSFIEYYIPQYKDFAEGGEVHGGYGPRIFNWKGVNQFEKVVEVLGKKKDSRQAVIQLFDASDLKGEHKDVPCTCSLQFLIRND